jgi:preprotein translocase SecF subunit
MRDIFPRTPKFDFLGYQRYFFLISAAIVIASFYVWFSLGESKYGIDFSGGHELILEVEGLDSADAIRQALGLGGLDATVKAYDSGTLQYAIRLQGVSEVVNGVQVDSESEQVKSEVLRVLKAAKGSSTEVVKVNVVATEFIGPTVGAELRVKALWAILFGLIGILGYLAFRFEFAFGLGAVVALAHDVIFALGVYLALGYTINMETLAAALTIVGYSVNDTIVIFDRVREEIFEERPGTLSEIVNRSINAMLSRTLVTHMLTVVSVIALLVFGSGAIKDMSVFLLAGLISGSYSTMYIASPVTIAWHRFRGGSEEL